MCLRTRVRAHGASWTRMPAGSIRIYAEKLKQTSQCHRHGDAQTQINTEVCIKQWPQAGLLLYTHLDVKHEPLHRKPALKRPDDGPTELVPSILHILHPRPANLRHPQILHFLFSGSQNKISCLENSASGCLTGSPRGIEHTSAFPG